MPIWTYLHIMSMVIAVTLLVGGDVFFHVLRRSGDTNAIRQFLAAATPLFRAGVGLLTIGVVFGLLTAASGGFDFTARWLIGAYVLVIALYVVGLFVGLPYYRDVDVALRADDDVATARVLAGARGWGSAMFSAVAYAVIIFLMVVKPAA